MGFSTGNAQDTARVAAQIVTGVGFLGDGAVIQTKREVHGLTTATILMVAAVGMAAAADLYLMGIATTILTTIVLVLLGPLRPGWRQKRISVNIDIRSYTSASLRKGKKNTRIFSWMKACQ